MGLFTKLFGTRSDREIKKIQPLVDKILALESEYKALSEDSMSVTKVGDSVKRGQVISGVGNSALFETLDPEHLHFELWVDGEAVDPEVYF